MFLRNALSNIRRSPFQAIAAILVLAITFFTATILATLIYSSAQLLNYFEGRPQIIAFLKNDASNEEVKSLENKLKADTRLKDMKFVSKEDALSIYKNATSNNPLLGQLVSPSIFPSSLEFSLTNLQEAGKIIDAVKKESIVDSVGFTASLGNETALKDVIERLTKITYYIRVGGLILSSVLALTSFLVLMVVVSMRIATKRSEIETLKLMGATPGFIRMPIILEAIIYAVVGVVTGWLMALILILYTTPTLLNYFATIPVLPRETSAFIELNLIILSIELLVGLLIAVLGGWAAVTRAISRHS